MQWMSECARHAGATGGSGSVLKSLKVSVLVHETEKPNASALLAMTLDAQVPKEQADLLSGAHDCVIKRSLPAPFVH